jgi:hypothetical protein
MRRYKGPPFPSPSFASISISFGQPAGLGSQTSTVSLQHRDVRDGECSDEIATMMVVATVGVLPAIALADTLTETSTYWSLQPRAAFVDAYVFACQPVEYDFAGAREPLFGVARKVYEQLLLGAHDGSCRSFYLEEVVPRLDVEMRPYFLPAGR